MCGRFDGVKNDRFSLFNCAGRTKSKQHDDDNEFGFYLLPYCLNTCMKKKKMMYTQMPKMEKSQRRRRKTN